MGLGILWKHIFDLAQSNEGEQHKNSDSAFTLHDFSLAKYIGFFAATPIQVGFDYGIYCFYLNNPSEPISEQIEAVHLYIPHQSRACQYISTVAFNPLISSHMHESNMK